MCENKNRDTVVYPDPFKGLFGENVFKFRDDIKAAIRDSQVKKADQVKTLLKYLRGDARLRVGDHQPDLDTALETLVGFYGNSNLIWLKCKQDFELAFRGDPSKNWGELGSTKRVDIIAKVMEFIRQSKQYAIDYPELSQEILSSHTVSLLTKIMPIDYIERIYLAMDTVTATPTEKINKIEEILSKLKTCAILAVNQLSVSKPDRPKQAVESGRNPLGLSMYGQTLCSVSSSHQCHRNGKCQPNWGLLGCMELYKLRTVDERVAYCKESNCCYVCGSGDLSNLEKSEGKHRRCNYKNPVDRFLTKCTAWRSKNTQGRKLYCFYGAALCPDHQNIPNVSSELLDWLKEKRIRHELFTVGRIENRMAKAKQNKSSKNKDEHVTDKEALDMLKVAMAGSDVESGQIQEIPQGENIFMFFLMQGKPGTDPIQVFCDTGANFWFAVESVTKKLVCVQTYKGSLPINVAGGKVVYSTGEWAAAIPLENGSFQAVRGLTMKSVVGQMPRFDLRRTLSEVKSQYKNNSVLQSLNIPPVLGGEVDMILGSKYLKIYPEPIQVTPSGLTVSMSRLRSPDGKPTAVISGPVKFVNQIFQTKYAKDCIESMKAMLVHASTYRPTLEYFPKAAYLDELVDEDIPEILNAACHTCCGRRCVDKLSHNQEPAVCDITVQGELQRFMELQEAGLKTEFRCKQCRSCLDCRKGAGHEKLSMKQEAENELIRQSITINKEEGFAVAKLPFIMPPNENLKNNRHIAMKMLDRVLKKYCTDPEKRALVLSGLNKMIEKKHLVYVDDLSKEHRNMLEKSPVSYYIPWNLQFKDSVSTPIRPVFNASSQSPSGLSLNDVIAKGSPDLVRLLSIMLEWQMGSSALCGDISQFYPTIKLAPEHWRFQRILLRRDLDPNGDLLEAVLVKLGFGVQSVSSQSEETVRRVAKDLWQDYPDVAALLINHRYVDDLAKSTDSKEQSQLLAKQTSSILKSQLNMNIKGWSIAGFPPPADVTKDGVSVDIGGHIWYTEADLFTNNIPPICLEKKQRGKLPDGVLPYDPNTMKLEEYVPENLTRRMITSTVAKVWDPLGKNAPVTLRLKNDLRRLIRESPEWDEVVSKDARGLWLQNFAIIEDIRGNMYTRCNRPADALRKTCRVILVVDAAEWGMVVAAYVGWERKNGQYSCDHLYGKGLLGPEQLTLAQKELHILSTGADISELLSNVLEDWIEEVIIASDSEISLCWSIYETVKLNQYNRVRVINIVSKIDLENLYHVKGTENPADIGTRMKMITASDVEPGSIYLTGKPWMKLSRAEAIKTGILRPVEDIRLSHEQKKVMRKGIVYDSFDEDDTVIGTLLVARVDVSKVAEREVEAAYPYSPLLRNFLSLVDITALILKPIKILQKIRSNKSTQQGTRNNVDSNRFSITSYYSNKIVRPPPSDLISEIERNAALDFIFRVETKILKKFVPKAKLDKIAVEENGILFCKTRALESQTVECVGGLNINTKLGGIFNINFKVPLIEQHSPLAYPIALHLHSLFNHCGVEACHRLSLNYVRIIGGIKIFRNISLNCVVCLKDRKRFLRMSMGPLADKQLYVSPVFYFTVTDMWGPFKAYCPGYERQTRRDKAYDSYFLVFACLATGAVNLQLLEGKSSEFVLEACSRFFNECSVPKIMYPDEDSALMKAFTEGHIDMQDLSGRLFTSRGILFETCPPQGHSAHGRVERLIRSMKDSFSRSGASSSRLTATGWTTIGKGLERIVNDTPIGFLYEKGSIDGNPLLRVLKPSSLKGMHFSDRAPCGLFSNPDDPGVHFGKIQEAYNLWANCWATAYVPLIINRQKWTVDDQNLEVNDIVYFMLEEKVKISWKIGKIDSVKTGRDGKVREVYVSYKIMKDDGWTHNTIRRPVRKIVKLFELKDTSFADEMKAVRLAAQDVLLRKGSLDKEPQVDTQRDPTLAPNVKASSTDFSFHTNPMFQHASDNTNTKDCFPEPISELETFSLQYMSVENWFQLSDHDKIKDTLSSDASCELQDEVLLLL